jgi:hypothetical protein
MTPHHKHKKYVPAVGVAGRWITFSGVPLAVCAILLSLTLTHDGSIRGVSENWLPYVIFFLPFVIIVLGKILYDACPSRYVIPFGVCGWIVTLVLYAWVSWT